jgi:hypothetical protein
MLEIQNYLLQVVWPAEMQPVRHALRVAYADSVETRGSSGGQPPETGSAPSGARPEIAPAFGVGTEGTS